MSLLAALTLVRRNGADAAVEGGGLCDGSRLGAALGACFLTVFFFVVFFLTPVLALDMRLSPSSRYGTLDGEWAGAGLLQGALEGGFGVDEGGRCIIGAEGTLTATTGVSSVMRAEYPAE